MPPCNKSSSSTVVKHYVILMLHWAKPAGTFSHLEHTEGDLHVCIDQAAGADRAIHLLSQHLLSLLGIKHCAMHSQGPGDSETHSPPPGSCLFLSAPPPTSLVPLWVGPGASDGNSQHPVSPTPPILHAQPDYCFCNRILTLPCDDSFISLQRR